VKAGAAMSDEERKIRLYIHPEHGAISYMPLDMMEVEVAAVQSGANANRDDIRVRIICEFIKQKFPKLYPEAKANELRSLISRFNTITIYDGIVLSLPGTIDGPAPPKNVTAEEFQRMHEQVQTLTQNLATAQFDRDKAVSLVHGLQVENQRFRNVQLEFQQRANERQAELQAAQKQEYDMRVMAQQYYSRTNDLEQEVAALTAELERARIDQQTMMALQEEMARLRQQITEARRVEQQLRGTLSRLEQENEQLRLDIQDFAKRATAPKNDEARNPWMD
jgi:DNA repair exonuclease SbcCD ATPase subunit